MKRILLLMAVLGALAADLRAGTILYMKSAVEVSSSEVLLGDLLVDVKGVPPEWVNRQVFAAPEAGKFAYHALTAVANGLARYDDMKSVTLSGEPVITISRRDRRISEEEFYEPLRDYLRKNEPWKSNDFDIKVLNIPRNARVSEGETTYRVTQIDTKTAKGYSLAYVSVLVNGIEETVVPVGLEIQFTSEVWVVVRNLERGQILSADDLRRERQVVDSTDNYVSCQENMEGYEVTRELPAGGLLRRNAVGKPQCAKRGDWVAINATGGGLHVTLRGKALANGRLGDRIMCVNERSLRQVLVELTGSGSGVLVRL